MKNRLVEIILAAAVVASTLWVCADPGFESFVMLLASLGAFLGLEFRRFQESALVWLPRKLSAWARKLRHLPPEAHVDFTILAQGNPEKHQVNAVRLYAGTNPTQLVWLMHCPPEDPEGYLIDTIEGHYVELFAADFDGDQFPEVAVRYACGAHSRGFRIYKLLNRVFRPIPGSDIGSDWPEILWEDRDGDGKFEIYTKNRDWGNPMGPVSVASKYVYRDGAYREEPNSSDP